MRGRGFILCVCLFWLVGCGPTRLYDWGKYEKLVYKMYTQPDDFLIEEHLDILSKEVEKTLSKDKLVPPGKHAHMGYLFYLQGDKASAKAQFLAEKNTFPKSARLMDRMLEGLN